VKSLFYFRKKNFFFSVTVLKTCFKIDKHVDSRTKRISIRLYTSEKFFYILFDSEQELDEWLDLMLVLQRATKEFGPGDSAKEPFGKHLIIFVFSTY